jgi:hypothetical protein
MGRQHQTEFEILQPPVLWEKIFCAIYGDSESKAADAGNSAFWAVSYEFRGQYVWRTFWCSQAAK